MLPQDVRDDLNKTVTITRNMLPADVLSDLNRTISKSMLGSDVLADLNKSSTTASPITLSMLAPEVTAKLDQNGSGGNTTVLIHLQSEALLPYLMDKMLLPGIHFISEVSQKHWFGKRKLL